MMGDISGRSVLVRPIGEGRELRTDAQVAVAGSAEARRNVEGFAEEGVD